MNKKHMCSMVHAYFDGQLAENEMKLLDKHCKECESCKATLKELNSLSDFLKVCHSTTPDNRTFSMIWDEVESTLVRDQLSLREVVHNLWEVVIPRVQYLLRPALVVGFVFFLFLIPFFEKQSFHEVYAVETEIHSLEAHAPVMILKTQQQKWTIIWVMPQTSDGGTNE
jgi:hypothetical protein